MAHANALKSPTPFSALGGGGANPGGMAGAPSSGILGGAINSLFGPSSFRMNDLRERAAVDRESARSENIGRFRQDVLNAMRQGQSVDQAVMGVIQSNPDVLSDPDFPKTAQDFVELIKPEEATPVVVPAQSRLATPGGEVLLEADPAPPANVKIIDEIEKAELKGDKVRVKRLQSLLPRDATNKITVMDALRLRIIGVEVDEDLSFTGVNKITSKQALAALNSGNDDRSATDNDLIQAAVAGDIPARQAIKVKTALKRQEMDAFMALVASQNPEFAKFITEKTPSVDEVFEMIDKGEVKASKGREFEVPIAGQRAPGADEAKGATTPPGLAAPAVGGSAGQAQGPTIDVQGIADSIKGLSEEDKAALKSALKAEGL